MSPVSSPRTSSPSSRATSPSLSHKEEERREIGTFELLQYIVNAGVNGVALHSSDGVVTAAEELKHQVVNLKRVSALLEFFGLLCIKGSDLN